MENKINILRKSFHSFFQNYQYFTFFVALILLPVSVLVLLSQAVEFFSYPLLLTIQIRLDNLFNASGFPPSSHFFFLLNVKLSQTITCSIFSFPFTLSFLLIAKSAVIQALHHKTPSTTTYFCLFSVQPSSSYTFMQLIHNLLRTRCRTVLSVCSLQLI
ncbi:hypothetical protein MKW92_034715 [Papaver armeniacum]|nr:hypothetical protein MKW92_034715 [Papaver armeniacum]